ncbi:hypothetical protein [Stenotrophomonas maltophilia]|uniref:hypothetical protein n=1 Tax=Stenotrophomonas maltophilia TaxID=40324 RepID=UPI0015DE9BD4|nr:hypothetical protein [Stenotrophomonas maltophilia]
MRELTIFEVSEVSGAASLAQPIDNPQSEYGKTLNDAAQLLDNIGSAIGIWLYDTFN